MTLRADPATRVLMLILLVGAACLGASWAVELARLKHRPLFSGVSAAQRAESERLERLNQADWRAARNVNQLARCLEEYKLAHPERGFPSALADLVAAGQLCVPPETLDDTDVPTSHSYRYVPALTSKGRIDAFTLCAQPIHYNNTGLTTVVREEAGLDDLDNAQRSRSHSPQAPGAEQSVSCAAAWAAGGPRGMVSATKHCALVYAAAHPALGYPENAALLAGPDSRCLSVAYGSVRPERDVVVWSQPPSESRVAYLPGLPDGSGRIETYEVRALGPYGIWSDETGIVHQPDYRVEQREHEPGVRARARLRVAQEFAANLPQLKRLCDEGLFASCADLGDALVAKVDEYDYRNDAWYQAHRLYRMACDGDVALGCLRAGALILEFRTRRSHGWDGAGLEMEQQVCVFLERACEQGLGEGCWSAAKVVLAQECSSRPTLTAGELLDRACRSHERGACAALGRMWLTERAVRRGFQRPVALLETACSSNDPAACGPLGQMYRASATTQPALALARHRLRRACALAADRESCAMLDRWPAGSSASAEVSP